MEISISKKPVSHHLPPISVMQKPPGTNTKAMRSMGSIHPSTKNWGLSFSSLWQPTRALCKEQGLAFKETKTNKQKNQA